MNPETENPQEAKVSVHVSLRGMLMLICVDSIRRVHNVGFLIERERKIVTALENLRYILFSGISPMPRNCCKQLLKTL